jgi:hypothetical protein
MAKQSKTAAFVAMTSPQEIQMKVELTDFVIEAAKPAAKAYEIWDTVVPGMILRVRPTGKKTLALIARFPGSRNPSRRRLGRLGYITLQDARKKASRWKEALQRGIDPAIIIKNGSRLNNKKRQYLKLDSFFTSRAWRDLRYEALLLHGARCQCCGATRDDGRRMHVDHIKPRHRFPELALTLENLQVLCDECNLGKSSKDATDWRSIDPTNTESEIQ